MLSDFCKNAGASAGTFKTSECAVKRFIFFYMNFCHNLFPSFAIGLELRTFLFFVHKCNSLIIYLNPTYVKYNFAYKFIKFILTILLLFYDKTAFFRIFRRFFAVFGTPGFV